MSMNKYVWLGLKLLMVFMFTAVITAILGYLGIRNMGKMNQMLTKMYDENLMPIVYVTDANQELVNHNRRLCLIVMLPQKDEKDTFKKKMLDNEKNLKKYLDQYRHTRLSESESERKLLAEFDTAWPIYTTVANQVLSLTYDGKNHAAEALIIGDVRTKFLKVENILSQIVVSNQNEGKLAYVESNLIYSRNRIFFTILVIVCVGISFVVSLLFSSLLLSMYNDNPYPYI
ncbi:MAG: MCP four helix bundle domain-containing protein [Phycisphaerae bacterium]